MPRSSSIAGALVAAGTLVVSCNAILDNQPAVILTPEDGGLDGALPSDDAGVIDAGTTSPSHGPDDPSGEDPSGEDPGGDGEDPGCPPGAHACGGQCVPLDDPRFGCGSPSCAACAPAHASAVCRAGACAVGACDQGHADCDGDANNGCESDLSKAASCGACHAACPPAAPLCAPSAGGAFACTNGCTPAAPLLCGKDCVDPMTDEDHCGACGLACPKIDHATTTCAAGKCTFTCRPGFHSCGATCERDDDAKACGPTCAVCPELPHADAACEANACVATCDKDYADCNHIALDGCEADLESDPRNCGECGERCLLGRTCEKGKCEADGGEP